MEIKKKPGSPDSRTINLSDDYEVYYWTTQLGVNNKKLTEAVNAVGNSSEAVRRYLKKK